jgi:hypothetical protein
MSELRKLDQILTGGTTSIADKQGLASSALIAAEAAQRASDLAISAFLKDSAEVSSALDDYYDAPVELATNFVLTWEGEDYKAMQPESSGSPLKIKGYLLGLVTFGSDKDYEDMPTQLNSPDRFEACLSIGPESGMIENLWDQEYPFKGQQFIPLRALVACSIKAPEEIFSQVS